MILLSSDTLPTRFRLFRKGINETVKGDFVFDDEAARLVMAEFERHGTDLMIDLEHLSLDSYAPNYKPDALGWFKLAVGNGELWAVDVKWNPEGIARLTDKQQRYVSPAFATDKENRIVAILNIALCAMPATRKPMPLVAASKLPQRADRSNMDELLKKLRTALKLADDATEDDIMAALATRLAADEETPPPVEDEEPTAEATQLSQLSKDVAALRAELNRKNVEDLIRANTSKISPAMQPWARTQTYEQLSAFLENAPAIHKAAATPAKIDPNVEILTANEIRFAKILGQDLNKLRDFKRSQLDKAS